jgi:predicted GNAT family N-acyltransferase
MSNLEITHQSPPVNEYIQLRIEIGWGALHPVVAESGFKNSIYQICIKENDLLIGYGRLFQDSESTFCIQDIIVKPSYQRKGLGFKIMEDIMRYVNGNLEKGCMVWLLASAGKESFYKKFGFMKKPNEKYSCEMIRIL